MEFAKKLLQEETTNEIHAASGSQSLTQTKLQVGQKRSSTVVQLTDNIGNEDETEDFQNVNVNKKARKTKIGEEFCFWTESQTKLLLSLYKEHQSKLDEGSMRHKVFWTLVVEGLKQKGHAFTTVQCSTKMDTLKRESEISQFTNWQ
ncbi:uncharacterized protein LOC107981984 [Nasonia vitripennis]|uniref:Myb/SANT-like DNA-binding domain-containing protein n=1 Tax=Nasonia vitripennis TaxID=7425 RepID=A0A7M7QAZ9_NASVI|nr:uncharacterized protein LOC107981984 [Nasonia vitripennis]XP_031784762.1 uncharacterized protein LOC107981984 [Nasonia vitripennis]